MDAELLKHLEEVKGNLNNVVPNLNGMFKVLDLMAKKQIEDLKATDPGQAEQKAREYVAAMKDSGMESSVNDLIKTFDSSK